MRAIEIPLYVLAAAGAFVVARGTAPAARPEAPAPTTVAARADAPPAPSRTEARAGTSPPTRTPRHATVASAAPAPRALRNEVIGAATRDMHARHADLTACLGGAELVGVTKVRFAVDVRGHEAVRWRFVEIIEGQALPDAFAACAERTLGGPHALVGDAGFEGTVDVVYVLGT